MVFRDGMGVFTAVDSHFRTIKKAASYLKDSEYAYADSRHLHEMPHPF